MQIKDELKSRVAEFENMCKDHGVKYMYAFGSVVSERFNPNSSDIDLLVEIEAENPLDRGEKLLDLWDKLELFFNRKVDLLTASSIKNTYLKSSIDKTRILIYDGKGQKISF